MSDLNAFQDRIRRMNEIFEIDLNDAPVNLGSVRLKQFKSILAEELEEIDSLIRRLERVEERCETTGMTLSNIVENGVLADDAAEILETMVGFADLLADLNVYVASESVRWGLPHTRVLHAVMDSQDSKLVDGKPIKDERNKFMKGPNYQPPEMAIRKILQEAK